MMWAALVIFAAGADCRAFVDQHQLQRSFEPQCIRVDGATLAGLEQVRPRPRPTAAPLTSPRPRPRPVQP